MGKERYQMGWVDVNTSDLVKADWNYKEENAEQTNETRFATNAIKLGETLEEISGTFSIDEMAKTMPFKEEEISNMIETLNFDWEQFDATDDDAIDLEAEDVFDNTIKIKVSKDTFQRWLELRKRMLELNGYDNESKVFEFAIIEALNIPVESLN